MTFKSLLPFKVRLQSSRLDVFELRFPAWKRVKVLRKSQRRRLTYKHLLYAEITSVVPSAGTLAGGSVLTITGFGFPTTSVSNAVTVVTIGVPVSTTFPNGVILCDVARSDSSQVTCVTRAHCAADANADDPTGADCNFRESLAGSVTVSVCLEGADADTCWADARTQRSVCAEGGDCTFSYSAGKTKCSSDFD